MFITAVQHVRRMRGGAQSHMMRCADGYYYVVKFQNNPQHTRVLVNDWLGTRLGEMIGLPMPAVAVVDVHPWLVEHTPELRLESCGQRRMITAGLSFGSRFVVAPTEGQVYDYLPEAMMGYVRNVRDFAGALALDKWTCNANGRQVAFWKKGGSGSFMPASSTRDIASMPESGVIRMLHCAGCLGAMMFMRVSQGGRRLSLG